MIIETKNLVKNYSGRNVVDGVSFTVEQGTVVGLLGPNGAGKSSLMDIISGRLQPTTGSVTVGQTVKIGYFAQHSEFSDENMRVLEYIKEANNYIETSDGQRISAAQMLERFLFPPELQWVPVSKLSGGEQRRLYLLRVLMTAPNVLILDEPTNDLDIPTLSVLEDYLDTFAGAVIAVSHDRYFLDRFAQKIFAVEKGGKLTPYIGGYSDYEETLHQQELEQAELAKFSKPEKKQLKQEVISQETPKQEKKHLTYGEKLELENIDQEIARAEAEVKMLGIEINRCGSDFVKLAELTKEQEAAQNRVDSLVERWAYLSELAEQD